MTYQTFTLAAAALVVAGAVQAQSASGLTGHALADDGTRLLTMADLSNPGAATAIDLPVRLDAIAHRPVTGDLLGFSRDSAVYVIDTASGEMIDLEAAFAEGAMIGGVAAAFDFNNAIDAARVIGSDGANLVYFPAEFGDERAGSVLRFTDAFYAAGDVNAGTAPLVYANAYTNAIAGAKAGSTAQYALDARTNALVAMANNAGELTTVGTLTIDGAEADIVTAGGFDIVSPEEGTDMAFAILQLSGAETSGLYSIDLATAEATLLADLGMVGLTGFAVSMQDL